VIELDNKQLTCFGGMTPVLEVFIRDFMALNLTRTFAEVDCFPSLQMLSAVSYADLSAKFICFSQPAAYRSP
jgi:hypothetical protein